METVISNDDRIAIAEVDYIIHHMNERYLNKIPQKVRDYITILKKRNMKIYVDPRLPLESQGLKEFTLYFLMILNLKYWCDDARRKEILLMLENNQRKFEDKVNNIFDNANSIEGDNNSGANESRQLNRPRQIIVTGSPTFPNQEANDVQTELKNNTEEIKQDENNTVEKTNALDDLAKETDAITKVDGESFFSKLIHKLKSFFVRK